MTTQPATLDRGVESSRAVLKELVGEYHPRAFAVRFWDGSTWEPEPGQPTRFTLILQHPGSLRKMFWPPGPVGFGEAYIYDDFDVQGDIHAFFDLVRFLIARKRTAWEKLLGAWHLWSLPAQGRPHVGRQAAQLSGPRRSLERDQQAISYHYDLSNDFFALWLDRRMVYSCAYFTSPTDDLDTAQERKLEYICRKLRLRSGERLLDIGCGWGGLVMHAARHHGAKALGITLSLRQAELDQERIRAQGLEGLCRVDHRDFRSITPESYDKVASVGMVEHLGKKLLPPFFRGAYRLLRPGGVFLNHGITLRSYPHPPWTAFARKYVFPDGELTPLTVLLEDAQAAGFEVRDVESLREHYPLTLHHWLQRLEARHEDVCRLTDEVTYRIFRLYLAGAIHGFESGAYNLHQTLLVKPDQGVSGLPLTRHDWYV
jgi:cyclopropane-fatty-acyl-phospholipid synthase